MTHMFTLTDGEKEALLTVRAMHEELARLNEGLRELQLLSISVSSPNMDGMPKAQSANDVYARTFARIEAREREIQGLTQRLDSKKDKVAHAIGKLSGSAKAFCTDYYLNGEPFVVAQAASGVGEKQCKNYMAEIKKKTGD